MFCNDNWRICCCSVGQSCPVLCDTMDCNTPGFPVLDYLSLFPRTHFHWISDAIHPSHPLRPLLLILWRTDFKNCESLYCIAVIYITLYINFTSTQKGIKKGTWKKKGSCFFKKKSVCQLLLQNKFSFISGSHIYGFCGELPLISWSQLGLWAWGFDLGMPHMSLFFFFFWRLASYPEQVLLRVKCRRPGEHLDSTSTFQVFIYIMSTDTPLAKANHMAKAKDKRCRSMTLLQKWRRKRYIFART